MIYSDATGLYKRWLLLDNADNRLNILLLNTFYELTEEYQNLNPDETYKEFLEYLELLREVQVDIEEKFDVENLKSKTQKVEHKAFSEAITRLYINL